MALIRQALTTLKALLAKTVRTHNRGTVSDVVLSRPKEDRSEKNKSLVDFSQKDCP